MGLFNIFRKKEPKPYRPLHPFTVSDEYTVAITAKEDLVIAPSPDKYITIDGFVTKAETNAKSKIITFEGVDGPILLPSGDFDVEINSPGRVSGQLSHEGTINAKTTDIILQGRIYAVSKANPTLAHHMTKVINNYIPYALLPESLQTRGNQYEIDPEEINGHWEKIQELMLELKEIEINANIVKLFYVQEKK